MSALEKRFLWRFLPALLITLLIGCGVCFWLSQRRLTQATLNYGERVASVYADAVTAMPSTGNKELKRRVVDDLEKDLTVAGVRLTDQTTGEILEAGSAPLTDATGTLRVHREVRVSRGGSSPPDDIHLDLFLQKPSTRDIVNDASGQIVLLTIISLISALVGAFIHRRLVAKPLSTLHKAIADHESGKKFVSWDEPPPPDELGTAMRAYESVCRDRITAEKKLIVSQERLKILSDNLPNAFLYQTRMTPDGDISFSFVGESVREVLGVTPEEVYRDASLLRNKVNPDYVTEMGKVEAQAVRMRAEFFYECPYLFPDGNRHWVQFLSRPSQMPDGEYLWQGVFIDVTEAREKDATLQHSRADAKKILNALPNPIFVSPYSTGRAGARFTHVNPSACEFLGMTEEELLAVGPEDVGELSPEEVQRIRSELRANKHLCFETTFIRKDGRRFPGEVCSTIIDFSGQTVSISVARSLEEQKHREKQLKDAAAQIEADRSVIAQKNIELSQLLHVLCHDLANPISALNGMLGLREKDAGSDLSELSEISTNVLQMIGLVHQLRSIEEGKYSITLKPVRVKDVLEQALRTVRPQLEKKELQIVCDVEESLMIKVEPISFLNSVIANLLTNAIKFSLPRNAIKIRALAEGGRAILEIRDSGIGMPPKLLDRIFDPKERTTRQGTLGELGTGYGMPLVKKFVELYGGEIRIISTPIGNESEPEVPGHGTAVTLVLDIPSPDKTST